MMLSVLALGAVMGARHAFEPDHIAAVSSLAAGQTGFRSILRHGATWGVGHTITLALIAGGAAMLNFTIAVGVGIALECAVGVMLVLLGAQVLWRLWSDRIHWHVHAHDGRGLHVHVHGHTERHTARADLGPAHPHSDALPWRSLAVGLVHGMAGSGALIVLTAASINDPLPAFGFILVFGVGSILGMAAFSAAMALPLTFTARRLAGANRAIQAIAGAGTLALGVFTATRSGAALWNSWSALGV